MYEYAKKQFEIYIKENFDMGHEKISHKLNHTYHVVNNAEEICRGLNLNDEDLDLAMVISLLHDIGRFDQAKQMNSFREDIKNYNHATLGVKLLFDFGEIRKFVVTDKYDNIIKNAIDKAKENPNLLVADYPRDMLDARTDDDLVNSIQSKENNQLEYLGAIIYGDTKDVNEITGSFQLWKLD